VIAVKPGVGVTFYGELPRDLDAHRDVIRVCDHVTLHTAADPFDVASAALVRQINPAARVWLAIPGNYLSRMDLSRGREATVAEARRCARIALAMGAELFEVNGEGASDGARPGDWTSAPGDEREARRLGSLAVEVLEAARAELGDRCALGWTSHDMPGFRLPWAEILSRVDLHSPQHYPAQVGRVASQRELEARIAKSEGRWETFAERSSVPVEAIPYGARWSPYLQGWGHQLGALVWGLCEAPIARLWACPGSWSPEAVEALTLARRLRAAVGPSVERWQMAHGLVADGVVGPATLASLRAP
jgi:hypothetical protein